ncbi:MAG TPA: TonB-dependent receptor [Edaphobacter sp.]|nr:TonB-dependent receptor [Edaphobacter sp.]
MPAARSKASVYWFVLLSLVCVFFSVSMMAQTITGAIRGFVSDPSGAVVKGAKVIVSNTNTGVKATAITDDSGLYNFPFLPIGTYTASAQAAGFDVTSVPPFRLEIDQIAKVNLTLHIGAQTTSVNVDSTLAPILNTENATLGATLSTETLSTMPLNGRNFSSATQFLPGAVMPQPTGTTGSNAIERATGSANLPSFSGNRQQTNNYLLDGADINESFSDTIGYNPSPDALGEMKVITGNADAEYGNVNGGAVLLSTKSGTNQYHGSAFYYLENNHLDANTWANKFSGVAKNSYTQSIFGATLGGPILHNKLFFFVDYQGIRYHTGGQGTASVAPAAFRNGDFSALEAKGIQLYDSQNNFAPFGGDRGVPIRNPVAQYLFAHQEAYPLPNRTPTDGIAQNNYLGYVKSFTANNQGDVRVDYTMSAKDTIMGRYSFGEAYDRTIHPVLPITFPLPNDYPVQSFVVNWTHVISPSMVNEARASFTRLNYGNSNGVDPTGLFGTSGNAVVGIPGGQKYTGFSQQVMTTGTISAVGTTAGVYGKRDNTFFYVDNLTWQRGKHITKMGVQFLRYQQNNFDAGNEGTLGIFQYSGQYTGNPALGKTAGYSYADFVLDYSVYAGVGGVRGFTGQRQWRDAGFVQDDWKVLSNLVLNLGLRYEYDQPIYEVNDKMTNIDLSNPSLGKDGILYAGKNGNSRALYDPVYTNFMPRLGFSYQFRPRLVLRGGYGSTVTLEGTGSSLRLTENPPYQFSYIAQATTPSATSGGTPLAVENGFATAPGNVSVSTTQFFAWQKNLRPSYIQQFNLTTEYQINNHTSLQVGYVGETGNHLIVAMNGNQWPAPCSRTCTNAPFYKLVGQTGLVKITGSSAMSNYNALQAILRRRMDHGFEYTINYTYAHSMTNSPGFYGIPGVNGASSYWQNAYNPSADYGPSGFDVRHNITATSVYAIPVGRNHRFGAHLNPVVNQVVGGWKVSGSAMLYTGFPVTLTSTNNANVNALTARANHYRPLVIRNRSTNHWFGTDASALPCPGAGNSTCAYGAELPNTFGTAAVGTERGPGYREIDLSIFKSFPVLSTEHAFDFRADLFNAFNFASYADPNRLVTDTNFGQITSTRTPPRQIQFSLRYHF